MRYLNSPQSNNSRHICYKTLTGRPYISIFRLSLWHGWIIISHGWNIITQSCRTFYCISAETFDLWHGWIFTAHSKKSKRISKQKQQQQQQQQIIRPIKYAWDFVELYSVFLVLTGLAGFLLFVPNPSCLLHWGNLVIARWVWHNPERHK